MRAIVIDGVGDDRRYVYADVPEPMLGPGEVLVDVRASALNQADRRMAASHFVGSEGSAARPIGGLEMAGEVVAVGPGVAQFAPGDRVMAMTGQAWAQRVAVDQRLALPVPKHFDWRDAGGAAVSFVTAYDCLTELADLDQTESVLVQGGTSAVGIALIQLASAMGARPLAATTTSTVNLDRLREVGCTNPIHREGVETLEKYTMVTGGRGFDLVVDIVGRSATSENLAAARIGGLIVCLGRLSGAEAVIDLDELARKRLRMVGTTFRTRSAEERIGVISQARAKLLPLLEDRAIHPVVGRVFSFSHFDEAYAYLTSGKHFGKLVLEFP